MSEFLVNKENSARNVLGEHNVTLDNWKCVRPVSLLKAQETTHDI